jgi:two-component system, NarL family, response regulator
MPEAKPKIRILVIDDHPVVRDGLASMIDCQEDMEVIGEGGTAQEGFELYHKLRPDILLLDLKLPDQDGVSVIERIRRDHPNARIIVLTTYAGDVQAFRALKAGAKGYLLKAALRQKLRASIRNVYAGQSSIESEVAAELAEHTADDSLTPRELEVLRFISNGFSNKLVADQLRIREDTVKGHVTSILAKLHASDRTHAVTIALQRGYLDL